MKGIFMTIRLKDNKAGTVHVNYFPIVLLGILTQERIGCWLFLCTKRIFAACSLAFWSAATATVMTNLAMRLFGHDCFRCKGQFADAATDVFEQIAIFTFT